jgi:hypothetical protein
MGEGYLFKQVRGDEERLLDNIAIDGLSEFAEAE